MTQHKIDVTPDKSLIKKLGRVGYRTEQAIAELIDNSIDARLDGTRETIRVVLDFADRTISVHDDGAGMDLETFRNSWVLGAHTKSSDSRLGMFGIGMKSACSALGKSFSVKTATAGSTTGFFAKYDEDEWLGSSRGWRIFKSLTFQLKQTYTEQILLCQTSMLRFIVLRLRNLKNALGHVMLSIY